MIPHPYQLCPLGKLYHEEALREARVRHMRHRAKAYPQAAAPAGAGALVPARQAGRRREALVARPSAKPKE